MPPRPKAKGTAAAAPIPQPPQLAGLGLPPRSQRFAVAAAETANLTANADDRTAAFETRPDTSSQDKRARSDSSQSAQSDSDDVEVLDERPHNATPSTVDRTRRREPRSEKLTLSDEQLSDIATYRPEGAQPDPSVLRRLIRPRTHGPPPNDYDVPNIATHARGTISQFAKSPGLPPIAVDSCESFATLTTIILAATGNVDFFRDAFHGAVVNYFVYLAAWFHQCTQPIWSRGGAQRRPTVSDVVETAGLRKAFPTLHVGSSDFVALPYANRVLANTLIDRLVSTGPDTVRGYVIVAGDYAFGVSALPYRVGGRLLSWTLVVSDSHGELPWAWEFACLTRVRLQSQEYQDLHRALLATIAEAAGVLGFVDALPTFTEGLTHFKRIVFTYLEHCRTEHGNGYQWASKYSTWVPITATQDPLAPSSGDGGLWTTDCVRAVTDSVNALLRTNELAKKAFDEATNHPLIQMQSARFFRVDRTTLSPVGVLSLWHLLPSSRNNDALDTAFKCPTAGLSNAASPKDCARAKNSNSTGVSAPQTSSGRHPATATAAGSPVARSPFGRHGAITKQLQPSSAAVPNGTAPSTVPPTLPLMTIASLMASAPSPAPRKTVQPTLTGAPAPSSTTPIKSRPPKPPAGPSRGHKVSASTRPAATNTVQRSLRDLWGNTTTGNA